MLYPFHLKTLFWKDLVVVAAATATTSSRPSTQESKIAHLAIVEQHLEYATLSEQKTEMEKEEIGKERERERKREQWR